MAYEVISICCCRFSVNVRMNVFYTVKCVVFSSKMDQNTFDDPASRGPGQERWNCVTESWFPLVPGVSRNGGCHAFHYHVFHNCIFDRAAFPLPRFHSPHPTTWGEPHLHYMHRQSRFSGTKPTFRDTIPDV